MRAFRDGENVVALKVHVVRIKELLLYPSRRLLPGNIHIHFVKHDLQRREDKVLPDTRRRVVDDDEPIGLSPGEQSDEERE